MIKWNSKDIIDLRYGTLPILAVYHNRALVWSRDEEQPSGLINSCFGNGYWIDDFPWYDADGWKDDA